MAEGSQYTLVLVVDAFPPASIIIKHVDKTGTSVLVFYSCFSINYFRVWLASCSYPKLFSSSLNPKLDFRHYLMKDYVSMRTDQSVTSGKETTIVETQSDNMISVTVHEIERVELTDNGVFVCTATNKLGEDEKSTTLIVGCE